MDEVGKRIKRNAAVLKDNLYLSKRERENEKKGCLRFFAVAAIGMPLLMAVGIPVVKNLLVQ